MTTPDSANLLRLLEPAVRPQGATGPATTGKPEFERQSFEQLLADARSAQQPDESNQVDRPPATRLIDALGRVENASLRALLGGEGRGQSPGQD